MKSQEPEISCRREPPESIVGRFWAQDADLLRHVGEALIAKQDYESASQVYSWLFRYNFDRVNYDIWRAIETGDNFSAVVLAHII
jgi:hypothetical protein